MTSEAKLVSGFSKISKEGNLPNTPHEANKKIKATKSTPPPIIPQNHSIYFLKLLCSLTVCFFDAFLAISILLIFLYVYLRQLYPLRLLRLQHFHFFSWRVVWQFRNHLVLGRQCLPYKKVYFLLMMKILVLTILHLP